MNTAVLHYYRLFRGNMLRPASEALASARQHVLFVARLRETVKASNKRSRAAKRGHATRKARAA